MTDHRKRIAVLGSTGSIGLNSISVIDSLGENFQLISASAHRQWQQLAQQARTYDLQKVVITDVSYFEDLKKELANTSTEVLSGPQHLVDLARDDNIDTVIVAVVGAAGLPAVLAAAQAGNTLAIANKESLVTAGCLVMPLARHSDAAVLPIDSEHSAILQAMHAGKRHEVEKVIITCSGGPFRDASADQIAQATISDALNHPTWNMGPKITIDSATLMNKALEIIEARWLFDLNPDQIEVLIHPESIIHSLVEFCDGSAVAQLSRPDMRLPIQYALTFPDRLPAPTERLNLHQMRHLRFEPPDLERFPALRLGFEVARRGGTAGAVLNAANEAAVEAFRAEKIAFCQIVEMAELCLESHNFIKEPDLQQLMEADFWARRQVEERIPTLGRPAGL
ncbi:MAG: 1-deoxy-D-xylulose-5-phosphate reductoisomerase [Planctomycetes bacterium]|nr:1-deoxy-D-xylulose-5-phosphate reductoisomerase [Planctomycetota bacterium]